MRGIFITGTDTGVGKTVVAACYAAALEWYYWKPVQSGMKEKTDSKFVAEITEEKFVLPERFRLNEPLSPNHAAELDGINMVLSDFSLPEKDKPIIVEGAGGVMVPINSRHFMIDLIGHLSLPCIIVARSCLGTLNHTLLTISELRRRGIEPLGVVLNGALNNRNKSTIEEMGDIRVVLEIEPTQKITKEYLMHQFWRRCKSGTYFG